jgi:hypothetical protein
MRVIMAASSMAAVSPAPRDHAFFVPIAQCIEKYGFYF